MMVKIEPCCVVMSMLFDHDSKSVKLKLVRQINKNGHEHRLLFYIDTVRCTYCPYCGIKINIKKVEE